MDMVWQALKSTLHTQLVVLFRSLIASHCCCCCWMLLLLNKDYCWIDLGAVILVLPKRNAHFWDFLSSRLRKTLTPQTVPFVVVAPGAHFLRWFRCGGTEIDKNSHSLFSTFPFWPVFFDAYLHLTVMIACLRLDSQSSPVHFSAQAADLVSSNFPIWAFG